MANSATSSDLLDSTTSWPGWGTEALDHLLSGTATLKARWWTDPTAIFREAGLTADPWQQRVLELASQADHDPGRPPGGQVLRLFRPGPARHAPGGPALVLVVSPSDRQSGEFVRKAKSFYYRLQGSEVPKAIADSARHSTWRTAAG